MFRVSRKSPTFISSPVLRAKEYSRMTVARNRTSRDESADCQEFIRLLIQNGNSQATGDLGRATRLFLRRSSLRFARRATGNAANFLNFIQCERNNLETTECRKRKRENEKGQKDTPEEETRLEQGHDDARQDIVSRSPPRFHSETAMFDRSKLTSVTVILFSLPVSFSSFSRNRNVTRAA